MKSTTKYLCAATAAFILLNGALIARAQTIEDTTVPEVFITQSGTTTINDLVVFQLANTTLFARTTWGQSLLRWTVKTNANTDIRKRYGDPKSVHDIQPGDYLSIEGIMEGGSSLSVIADKIIDWSDYTTKDSLSGTITGIVVPNQEYTLTEKDGSQASIFLTATSTIYRNRREILPKYIRVGDPVTAVNGTYDTVKRQMTATTINITLDPQIFAWQNYQGTLKTLPSGSPATFILTIGGKDYTIVMSSDATILNERRYPATYDRFLAGDTVRVYGHIREDDDQLDTINATVVRDISF